MKTKFLYALVAGALITGCGSKSDASDAADDAADDGGDSGSTTDPGATSIVPGSTGGIGDSGSSGGGFIMMPDGNTGATCDIWVPDDCPDGEKCVPWANDGGSSWNATKCVDIDNNAVEVGDTCMAEGSGVSGIDNCPNRSMCYYLNMENIGVCIPFCTGTPETPSCESPDDVCTIVNNGVLTLCRPKCDPILQDCMIDNTACLVATSTDEFTCIIDASGDDGAAGDTCGFINDCDPGNTCVGADALPVCAGDSCCAPFCDRMDQAAADTLCDTAAAGTVCESWYTDPGMAPPAYQFVGVCVLPG